MEDDKDLSMRAWVAEKYGLIVPDEAVSWDTPDAFAYRAPSGMIIGFNKSVYKFWRNCVSNNSSDH